MKPLGVIWGKFPQYTPNNTIMFDDIRRNFLMNPQAGLKIRPFRNAHQNREHDRELLQLAGYLKAIASLDDLAQLNHKHWERYGSSHKSKKRRSKEDPVLWARIMNEYVWSIWCWTDDGQVVFVIFQKLQLQYGCLFYMKSKVEF